MPKWRNGRRARLKIAYRKMWRFESSLRHISKKKIIVIVGPTSSGKSSLAVQLAREFNGEIISADSRQVYRGLDIGTGKISPEEMENVPHHLLDVADPKEVFSASQYKNLAQEAIKLIIEKDRLPIIVGGTGFYIDILTGEINLPEVPPNEKLRQELEKKTSQELFEELTNKDPRRSKEIDPKNKVRIMRALEIIEALGKVPTKEKSKSKDYDFIFIGLKPEQDELDIKIKKRLLDRLENGMINEAENLHNSGLSFERMNGLGLEYRYLSLYLQNKITKEEMLEKLYIEIRHYAKRQMTWFKMNKSISWFKPMEAEKIKEFLKEKIS